mmetsp:Transcript_22472/g.41360  ORF Transcript_22472/g.41360 Transcript_22472/m.41360 type:complete len:184 (+) Transcript_22472:40-591(+)
MLDRSYDATDEERRPRRPSDPGLLRHWGEDGKRGRGLRGLLMSANIANQDMDRRQVAHAQGMLDQADPGSGRKATLIYAAFSQNEEERKRKQSAEESPEGHRQREPDPVLEELWAPRRCSCVCGCRAEFDGSTNICRNCRNGGRRHMQLMGDAAQNATSPAAVSCRPDVVHSGRSRSPRRVST